MKGIILAAGNGTRLYPASLPVSKILLTIYDKPMLYYPLCTLMTAGIRDILIIVSESDKETFRRTLGDGSQFGVRISYAVQPVQRGIADAFLIARDYIAGDRVVLILGDNVFHGRGIDDLVKEAAESYEPAVVFGYRVADPKRFGVVGFDDNGTVLSLEEKPENPKSDYAVVGLYFYDGTASDRAEKLTPSKRGELEITDLNISYLRDGLLSVKLLDEDVMWMDTGTFESMAEACNAVRLIERDGELVGSPEMVALKKGWVTPEDMRLWLSRFKGNSYFDPICRFVG